MATKNSNDSLHNEEFGGKKTTLHDEVLVNPELMSDAFMAENREHEMGLWVSYVMAWMYMVDVMLTFSQQAMKAHPTACFWAFMMCFTIVSRAVSTNGLVKKY